MPLVVPARLELDTAAAARTPSYPTPTSPTPRRAFFIVLLTPPPLGLGNQLRVIASGWALQQRWPNVTVINVRCEQPAVPCTGGDEHELLEQAAYFAVRPGRSLTVAFDVHCPQLSSLFSLYLTDLRPGWVAQKVALEEVFSSPDLGLVESLPPNCTKQKPYKGVMLSMAQLEELPNRFERVDDQDVLCLSTPMMVSRGLLRLQLLLWIMSVYCQTCPCTCRVACTAAARALCT